MIGSRAAAARVGTRAAVVAAAGIVLSGPVSLVLVEALAPQPPWQDAAQLAAHFHPLQLLPYVFGFALVGGFVVLHAALVGFVHARERPFAIAALAFTAVFAALICFNYTAQLAIVPALRTDPASAGVVAALSMTNPRSICWFLEMFGYGVLGVASMLVAPCFHREPLERAAAVLLWANGGLSVVGAALTAWRPAWVMTGAGLVAYGAWNALVLAMTIVIALVLRRHR